MNDSRSLFHYTDAHGLYGILDNTEFWATDIEHMNDSTEGTFGKDQLDQVLHDLDPTPAEPILKVIREANSNIFYPSEHAHRVYAVCLSQRGDQLSQWRGYGDNGYCIEFDANELYML